MDEHLPLLRRVSIFAGLDEAALRDLAQCLVPRLYLKEAVIVNHDDGGDSMFVIAEGRVKVVLYGEGGREMILSVFRQGDFFGEMSLLDGQPRSASVIATEDSRLLVLEREAFVHHIESHAATALAILSEMSLRLRRADEIIGNLALLDVYSRLGRMLRDIGEREGQPCAEGVLVPQRPTHQDLASMIGTSRETVSRIIGDFQRQGLLAVEGKTLLLRPALLRG